MLRAVLLVNWYLDSTKNIGSKKIKKIKLMQKEVLVIIFYNLCNQAMT